MAAMAAMAAPQPAGTLTASGSAPVNSLELYYEIHGGVEGNGVPLALLHRNLSTVEGKP